MSDRGVTPDLVGRNSRGAERDGETRLLARERISSHTLDWRQNVVARAVKQDAKERDLASLAEIQAKRPLKPPGR